MKPLTRFILVFLLPLLSLPLLIVLLIWVPLPPPLPPGATMARQQMAAIVTAIFGVIYLLTLVANLISLCRDFGRRFEKTLVENGFTARGHLIYGRKYAGTCEERNITVEYIPARMIWPNLLSVEIPLETNHILALGNGRPIRISPGLTAIDSSIITSCRVMGFADDKQWADSFLKKPELGKPIEGLLGEKKQLGLREIYIQPGSIRLRSHPKSPVTGEELMRWIHQLLKIAQTIDVTYLYFREN